MNTSLRFCLSYDCLIVDIISVENINVVTDNIMTLRASNQVLCNVLSYGFYDMTLATE